MSIYEVTSESCAMPAANTFPLSVATEGAGHLRLKVDGENLEFSYRPIPALASSPALYLSAPVIEVLEGGMLDPSLSNAFVRIAPYPNMLCGDKLVLSWQGLDDEGLAYSHEATRSVSEGQVGAEIVFVIKGQVSANACLSIDQWQHPCFFQ